MNHDQEQERERNITMFEQEIARSFQIVEKTQMLKGKMMIGEDTIRLAKDAIRNGADPEKILSHLHEIIDAVAAMHNIHAASDNRGKGSVDMPKIPADAFQKFLRLCESTANATLALSEDLRMVPIVRIKGAEMTTSIVNYKVVIDRGGVEKSKTESLSTDSLEKELSNTLQPEDILLLEKFAQEAGPAYAQVVSMLRHILVYGEDPLHPNPPDRWEDILAAIQKIEDDAINNPNGSAELKRLVFLEQGALETEKIPTVVLPMLLYKAEIENPSHEAAMNDVRKKLCQNIAYQFLSTYVLRDHEQITEENVNELAVSFALCISNPSLSREQKDAAALALAEGTFACLASALGKERAEEIRVRIGNIGSSKMPDAHRETAAAIWKEVDIAKKIKERAYAAHSHADNLEQELTFAAEHDRYSRSVFLRFVGWNKISAMERVMAAQDAHDSHDKKRSLQRKKLENAILETARILVGATDKADELLEVLGGSFFMTPHIARGVQRIIIDRFIALPGAISELLNAMEKIESGGSADDMRMDPTRIITALFSLETMQKHPELLQGIFAEINAPDAKKFYNACIAVSLLFNHAGTMRETMDGCIASCFGNGADLAQPSKLFTLRCILRRLRPEIQQKFCEQLIATVAIADLNRGMITGILGLAAAPLDRAIDQKLKTEEKEQKKQHKKEDRSKPGIDFLLSDGPALEATLVFPDRTADIADVKARLLRPERTIQLGDDTPPPVDSADVFTFSSPFQNLVDKCSFKRLKNATVEGIACTATLTLRDGRMIYCRLDDKGNLAVRVLDSNGTEKESETNAIQATIPKKMREELQYVILMALETVYTKKEHHPEPHPATAPPNPIAAPPTPAQGVVMVDELPPAQREAPDTYEIDLTEEEQIRRRRAAARERRVIGDNRDRVVSELQPFLEGHPPEGKDAPPTWNDLIMYVHGPQGNNPSNKDDLVLISPRLTYALLKNGRLTVDQIFVRTKRAFATPLSYIRKSRTAGFQPDPATGRDRVLGITKEEFDEWQHAVFTPDPATGLDAKTGLTKDEFDEMLRLYGPKKLSTVKPAGPTAEADALYEHFLLWQGGETLNRESFGGILSVKEYDTPHTRAIFDYLKSDKALADFMERRKKEIDRHRDDMRRCMRYYCFLGIDALHPVDAAKRMIEYAEAMQTAEREATQAMNAAKEQWTKEMRERLREEEVIVASPDGPQKKIRLHLPILGRIPFHQTFNRGQFETVRALIEKMPDASPAAETP